MSTDELELELLRRMSARDKLEVMNALVRQAIELRLAVAGTRRLEPRDEEISTRAELEAVRDEP